MQKDWRGNIRKLENLMARYAILGCLDDTMETPGRKPPSEAAKPALNGEIPLKRIAKQAVREMETSVILRVLRDTKWNRRKAAQILDISYRALIYKIKEAGLAQKRGSNREVSDVFPSPQSNSR